MLTLLLMLLTSIHAIGRKHCASLCTVLIAVAGFYCASVNGAESTDEGKSKPATITVVSDDNYPPYIFRTGDGHLTGYNVDLWKLWEARTGVHVNLIATDWAKAQDQMAAGKADVIDTMFRTPQREKLYDFWSG